MESLDLNEIVTKKSKQKIIEPQTNIVCELGAGPISKVMHTQASTDLGAKLQQLLCTYQS